MSPLDNLTKEAHVLLHGCSPASELAYLEEVELSVRFRARSAVAAGMHVLLLLTLAAPAWGSHTTGHAHSVAAEVTSNRGGASTRWDNTMAGIPNNGCVNPITGSPMYQSMWIRTGGPGWIELGTGHQCQDSFRYWYWGWGNSSGTWALWDGRTSPERRSTSST